MSMITDTRWEPAMGNIMKIEMNFKPLRQKRRENAAENLAAGES